MNPTKKEHTRLETRIWLVTTDQSYIYQNWNKHAGVSKEDFISGLRWLEEDPLDSEGRMTRELGCTEKGLRYLTRTYYTDGMCAMYDEDKKLWCGNGPSINVKDRV